MSLRNRIERKLDTIEEGNPGFAGMLANALDSIGMYDRYGGMDYLLCVNKGMVCLACAMEKHKECDGKMTNHKDLTCRCAESNHTLPEDAVQGCANLRVVPNVKKE